MNIYLIWPSVFLTENDNISIFALDISQDENSFAQARLVIDALSSLPSTGTEGIIRGEDGDIFFKGLLVGNPTKMDGDFAEVELIARPSDFPEQQAALQKENRMPPYWDDLWVRPEHHDNFEEVQDVRTSSMYCDRRTGELSRSDWFEGKQTLLLHQGFFPDSLQTKVVGTPLKACTVKVHAHWIQSESGVSNLSSSIRKAFPHFKMSTYTQNSLLKKWPQSGQRDSSPAILRR